MAYNQNFLFNSNEDKKHSTRELKKKMYASGKKALVLFFASLMWFWL